MKNTRFRGTRGYLCRVVLLLTLVGLPVAAGRTAEASSAMASPSSTAMSAFEPASWQDVAIGHVDAKVFAIALKAAANAIGRGDVANPGTLTVIDYSKPSTQRRMWVY